MIPRALMLDIIATACARVADRIGGTVSPADTRKSSCAFNSPPPVPRQTGRRRDFLATRRP